MAIFVFARLTKFLPDVKAYGLLSTERFRYNIWSCIKNFMCECLWH